MAKANKVKGVVLYIGPSLIDGERIMCIATLNSDNVKTGNMISTWIMRVDVDPVNTSRQGGDVSVCGNCKHRRNTGGSCYVTLFQAPLNVWKAFHRGNYEPYNPDLHDHLFQGRALRIGSYGDGAAVPLSIWQHLTKLASGHTAYTHQWLESPLSSEHKEIFMASVDNVEETEQAHIMGYRTFRVRTPDQPLMKGEMMCPAADETAKGRMTCDRCLLCNGTGGKVNKNIAIVVHGQLKTRFKTEPAGV